MFGSYGSVAKAVSANIDKRNLTIDANRNASDSGAISPILRSSFISAARDRRSFPIL